MDNTLLKDAYQWLEVQLKVTSFAILNASKKPNAPIEECQNLQRKKNILLYLLYLVNKEKQNNE